MRNLNKKNRNAPKSTREIATIPRVFFTDFLNNFPVISPVPNAGSEKPPIKTAIIFAMGMRIKAGRKIIAWAGVAEK